MKLSSKRRGIFYPNSRIDKMIHLTPADLKAIGCKGLLLDVDNTMTTHGNPVPADGVAEWLSYMSDCGFKLIIVSNNTAARVEPFAKELGLSYISMAAKPLATGFNRACKKLALKPSETVVVGDQIFTDIIGGNLLGVYTILTTPYKLEDGWFMRLKRVLELPILRKIDRLEEYR
ncbi:MAG: YqeG family HAD IIIA-type phosphatase [Oscillospiraceae bacterium]|jgi:HAD superfamily phosphatase (TIGR01668 family)|nr:YqeG family HAD IIIA-type phosphatase [Oscillospiraceae bacterium]